MEHSQIGFYTRAGQDLNVPKMSKKKGAYRGPLLCRACAENADYW